MGGSDPIAGDALSAATNRCPHCGTDAPAVRKRRLNPSGRRILVLIVVLGMFLPGVALLLLASYGEWAGLPPFAVVLGIVLGGAVLSGTPWVIATWGTETVSTCPQCKGRVG